ncbi:MAG: DsrE/DsrF/DrsH-like family protein [Elusimicrobia bacterium]|jgi:peroxiredoxin family protein|nr:DsrE/DsrF/DrsH-like family protein [Elusimicrobiota bacterium]
MKKEKMTLIFFSGTMDKALAMLMLATTGASMGMEVEVFFTFWGLSFLKKGKKYRRKGILQKMMEFMMPGKKTKLPLTSMNMMGMGPAMMRKLMKKTKTPSVEEFFEMAKEMGVKFYACSTSCGIMGVDEDSLIDDVEETVGAAWYIKEAKESEVNLFI